MKKKETPSEYIILKLTTGDEVIGLISSKTVNYYVINQPLYIISYVSDTGVAAVYLKRYLTLPVEKTVTITKELVAVSYTPNILFVKYYLASIDYYENVSDVHLLRTVSSLTSSIKEATKKYLHKDYPSFEAWDDQDTDLSKTTKTDIKH